MRRYIISIIFSFLFFTIGISQDENEIRDIYTIEDDSTYSLIIDHNHKKLEYFVQEIFDPPTLIIEINNVSWGRGNFSRKIYFGRDKISRYG